MPPTNPKTAGTSTRDRADSHVRNALGIVLPFLAALLVGGAIYFSGGSYSAPAIGAIGVALALSLMAVVCMGARFEAGWIVWLLLFGILCEVGAFAALWLSHLEALGVREWGILLLALLIGVASVGIAIPNRRLSRAAFTIVLTSYAVLTVLVIQIFPPGKIDVWFFQQIGAEALLHGINPYSTAAQYPDIYHHPGGYGPGMVEGDVLKFGFPYPPVSLLLSTAGYALTGEHRYAQATAMLLSGLLIGLSRPGRIAFLSAVLLLMTPGVFFILQLSWTEPLVVLLFSATLFCALRSPRLLPIALGLFLASKQYALLLTPLTFMLLPSPWSWRAWGALLLKSALVGAIVTLPFALIDWPAFYQSTVRVHLLSPFNADSLSFVAWWIAHGGWLPGMWLPMAGMAIALALSIWRGARTPAGFSICSAFVLMVFFMLAKQAGCNYYLIVIAALCGAIAASGRPIAPIAQRRVAD